ncbi:MAG: YggT family protein [Treponemataceae bacterium]|nr:YggT family protein [Treponemataceae bacterium]
MNLVAAIFRSLGTIIQVYSTICLIRIFLTWVPQLNYSKVGQVFSMICDPYLNLFSRIRFLRIGMLDFSPILAFAILQALSTVFFKIANSGSISLAFVLSMIMVLIWNMFSSILILIFIILVIRLIVLLAKRNTTQFWYQVDTFSFKMSYPFAKIFTKNRGLSVAAATILTLFEIAVLYTAGRFAVYYLLKLISLIPF